MMKNRCLRILIFYFLNLCPNNGCIKQQNSKETSPTRKNCAVWRGKLPSWVLGLDDRIVPGFPKVGADEINQRIGATDNLIVQGESYHLWVIEVPQNISIENISRELPTEKADLNVIFTHDEGPYHLRKVTLLNGPHTVLAPVAYLAGLDIVRDACNHPVVGQFIRNTMFNELLPTLDMPYDELTEYADSILERFCNPYVNHQLTSIMLNSFSKFKTRVAGRGEPFSW